MFLRKILYISLIFGIFGVILLIVGEAYSNKLATIIGFVLIMPLIYNGLRGKQIKRIQLTNYLRRRKKLYNKT